MQSGNNTDSKNNPLSIQSDSNWKGNIMQKSYIEDTYQYKCIKGKLHGSKIEIHGGFSKSKLCYIALNFAKGDKKVIDSIKDLINKVSNVYLNDMSGSSNVYEFQFKSNDEQSEKFLNCINLINIECPMGKEIMFSISKAVRGFAIEGNPKGRFVPILEFFLIMNMKNIFPRDITNIICHLFIQDTYLEIAPPKIHFHRNFTLFMNKALDRSELKKLSIFYSENKNDNILLITSDSSEEKSCGMKIQNK